MYVLIVALAFCNTTSIVLLYRQVTEQWKASAIWTIAACSQEPADVTQSLCRLRQNLVGLMAPVTKYRDIIGSLYLASSARNTS